MDGEKIKFDGNFFNFKYSIKSLERIQYAYCDRIIIEFSRKIK